VHVFVREEPPAENLFDRAAKSSSFRAIKADTVSTAHNAMRSRMAMKDVSEEAWRATVDVDEWQTIGPGGPAAIGELVADVILAPAPADPMSDEEPEVAAWLGLHRHDASRSPYPGGGLIAEMPVESPSRAYCKIEEAIAWAGLPIEAGQTAVEIGAAPGGAVMALARRGLNVVAVDTGDLAAQVLAYPNVTHIAKKVGAVRWEELPEKVDWLLVDMNLAPQVAVHEVARLMPHLIKSLRGAVITLKLNDWAFVDELPRLTTRIAELGLPNVRLRHLPSNRREVCCVALR
jgi:23S rRNA (cytidine2498-2'-O)-methyltransferase